MFLLYSNKHNKSDLCIIAYKSDVDYKKDQNTERDLNAERERGVYNHIGIAFKESTWHVKKGTWKYVEWNIFLAENDSELDKTFGQNILDD